MPRTRCQTVAGKTGVCVAAIVSVLVVAAVAIVAAGSAAPVLCPVSGIGDIFAPFDLSRLLIDFHDRRLSPARATKDYSDVDVVHLRKRGKQPRAAAQLEALAVTPAQRDERQRGQRRRQYDERGRGRGAVAEHDESRIKFK